MADEAQVLAEAAKQPLSEQLAHSSWKVRAQALTSIQQKLSRAFSCEDAIFAEAGERQSPLLRRRRSRCLAAAHGHLTCLPLAGPLLVKAVGDSNANVMDKAVETLVTYLEKADEGIAARCVESWDVSVGN